MVTYLWLWNHHTSFGKKMVAFHEPDKVRFGRDVVVFHKETGYLISTKLVFLVLNTHEKVTTYIPHLERLATNQIKLVNQKGSERRIWSRVWGVSSLLEGPRWRGRERAIRSRGSEATVKLLFANHH